MGTYKVPQNVEAEDKILGPLSLKQFIYALIGLGWGFLTFAILKSVLLLWIIVGVPPMLFMLGLGLYQRDDQPLETYVVAIAQYFVRPRTRFWSKEPISEVFRLEPPPPKEEQVKRDPREVHSQLQQLAQLVDTRGWSMKEPELTEQPDEAQVVDLKDRIGVDALSQPPVIAAASEVTDDDDILSNQTKAARDLNVLIENSVKSLRAEAMEKMRSPQAAATPPAKTAPASAPTTASTTSGSTAPPSGDILKLAAEGGELKVSQIAAQAHKQSASLAEGQTVNLRNATTA